MIQLLHCCFEPFPRGLSPFITWSSRHPSPIEDRSLPPLMTIKHRFSHHHSFSYIYFQSLNLFPIITDATKYSETHIYYMCVFELCQRNKQYVCTFFSPVCIMWSIWEGLGILLSNYAWVVGEVLVHFGAFPEFSNFPLRATPAIKVWNGKHKNWKKKHLMTQHFPKRKDIYWSSLAWQIRIDWGRALYQVHVMNHNMRFPSTLVYIIYLYCST